MMLLFQSATMLDGEADILSAPLQFSLSTKHYRDFVDRWQNYFPFVIGTLGNLQLMSQVNLYIDDEETHGKKLINIRWMKNIDAVRFISFVKLICRVGLLILMETPSVYPILASETGNAQHLQHDSRIP